MRWLSAAMTIALLSVSSCGKSGDANSDDHGSKERSTKDGAKAASREPTGMWTQGERAETPPEWWTEAGYRCPEGTELRVDPDTEGRDAWCAQDGGRPDGPKAGVHVNGARRSLGSYANGKRSGTWRQWYPDGQLWQEQTFVDDKMHDVSTMWHANGQKKREGSLEHGTRVGTWTEWDENGEVTKTTEYVDGKPVPE